METEHADKLHRSLFAHNAHFELACFKDALGGVVILVDRDAHLWRVRGYLSEGIDHAADRSSVFHRRDDIESIG